MAHTVVKRVGGKVKIADWIKENLPSHNIYCEPFGGSFAVGMTLPRATQDSTYRVVYNDLDRHIHNFFEVLRDHKEEFLEKLEFSPYERQEFERAYEIIHSDGEWKKLSKVEWARLYLIGNRQSFAGKEDRTWSISRQGENNPHTWRNLPKLVAEVADHLRYAFIENSDYRDIFRRWDSPETVFYCMSPETLIRFDDETVKPVKNVKTGDVLFGGRKVKRVMSRLHKGTIFNIKVQGMPDSLLLTENHVVPVLRSLNRRQDHRTIKQRTDQIEYVKVNTLRQGDYMLVPVGGKEIPVNWQFSNESKKQGKRGLITFNPDDSKIARFLGLYAAEGHCDLNTVRLSFSADEAETLVAETVSLVKDIFGLNARVYDGPTEFNKNSVRQVVICSRSVVEFCKKYVRGTAIDKELAPELLTLPVKQQLCLLTGWLSGDGGQWFGERGKSKVTGTSASYILARQFHTISLRCGLRPSFKTRKSNGNTCAGRYISSGKLAYDVYFSSSADLLSLGYSSFAKKDRSTRKIINGYIYSRIKDIKQIDYDGEVFDIDVDQDDQYIANGILVHNCDPPYEAVESDYYHVNKEGGFNHVEMAQEILKLKGSAVVSYYKTDSIIGLYPGFEIKTREVIKHMQTKAVKDKVEEMLLIKYSDWAKAKIRDSQLDW